jgi:hypothetical protein
MTEIAVEEVYTAAVGLFLEIDGAPGAASPKPWAGAAGS